MKGVPLEGNKYLAWLGSSSAVGVLDSNGLDQGTILGIVEAGQHSGRIIWGGPHNHSI